MDPNSHNFHLFDHLAGYYPPTPGGAGGSSNNNASALFPQPHNAPHHATAYGSMGISTPLSMPTSEAAIHPGQQTFHNFPGPMGPHMQQSHFSNLNPFQMPPQSFPPHHFSHQPAHSHFDMEAGPIGESPIDDIGIDLGASQSDHSPQMLFRSQHMSAGHAQAPLPHSSEK